jgi:hypothetical protein
MAAVASTSLFGFWGFNSVLNSSAHSRVACMALLEHFPGGIIVAWMTSRAPFVGCTIGNVPNRDILVSAGAGRVLRH